MPSMMISRTMLSFLQKRVLVLLLWLYCLEFQCGSRRRQQQQRRGEVAAFSPLNNNFNPSKQKPSPFSSSSSSYRRRRRPVNVVSAQGDYNQQPGPPPRQEDATTASLKATTTTTTHNNHDDSDAPLLYQDKTAPEVGQMVLNRMKQLKSESMNYATSFGLEPSIEGALFALFRAIRDQDLVRRKLPLVLRHEDIVHKAWKSSNNNNNSDNESQDVVEWPGFFTMTHLERALEEDFLDAARGSTDNRKGWMITDVSVPRGDSFEEARMTYEDVQLALDKGTVIFNAAGAHIPRLAGPTLACTDATALPCALNLYITAAGKRTSAPPHTDKQDVVVIQSTGCKHWKVYAPPPPARKPQAERFTRGKMEDSLPLYLLEEDLGCELLLETTLFPGDVLFIPAAFPHTTSTLSSSNSNSANAGDDQEKIDQFNKETSVHLTMGFDHHIWDLNYLSVRRYALRRAGVIDTALGRTKDEENPYTGASNELPTDVGEALFAELPLGLLEDDDQDTVNRMVEEVTREVERISRAVDERTAQQVPNQVWKDTVQRVRQQGVQLWDIHRDMYLAALEEGRVREAEDAMTAHLEGLSHSPQKRSMTPERIQRLSLFRVKRFFDQIEQAKQGLREWSWQGSSIPSSPQMSSSGGGAQGDSSLPQVAVSSSTPAEAPAAVKVGDQVEADLGGAYFSATVTRVSADGTHFDVQFFDGDRETDLTRSQIKLPPQPTVPVHQKEEVVDTSSMTRKQLKRWRKQQEKLKRNS